MKWLKKKKPPNPPAQVLSSTPPLDNSTAQPLPPDSVELTEAPLPVDDLNESAAELTNSTTATLSGFDQSAPNIDEGLNFDPISFEQNTLEPDFFKEEIANQSTSFNPEGVGQENLAQDPWLFDDPIESQSLNPDPTAQTNSDLPLQSDIEPPSPDPVSSVRQEPEPPVIASQNSPSPTTNKASKKPKLGMPKLALNKSKPAADGSKKPTKPFLGKGKASADEYSTEQSKVQNKPLTKVGGNKRTSPVLYVLPLLLLILGGWYWFNRVSSTPAESVVNPAPTASVPVATPAPQASVPAVATASSVAIDTQYASVAAASTSGQTTIASSTAGQTPQIANQINILTPEQILAPELPQDPTLAKEELDRLDEQSNQLTDQQTMMNEQLDMLNELSSKKEERIRLLEQRIAELERQQTTVKPAR